MNQYGFEFHLWQTVYNNGLFSGHTTKNVTIVARTQTEASQQVEEILEKGKSFTIDSGKTIIKSSNQYIQSVRCLGKAIKVTKWEFLEKEQPRANRR